MRFNLITDDALESSLTDQGLLVWGVWWAIVSRSDRDGFTSVTPRSIAKTFGHPLKEVEKAWKILASPDPNSKNAEHEGKRIIPTPDGRWLIVSKPKYNALLKDEYRREQLRLAKQRERERKKEGEKVSRKKSHTPKKIDSPEPVVHEPEPEEPQELTPEEKARIERALQQRRESVIHHVPEQGHDKWF